MKKWKREWTIFAASGLALGAVATYQVERSIASDHQDTPEVELSPRMDINDVYAFPGTGTDRIALVMTTSSPITPGATAAAAFDPNLLYQIKVDNTGDAKEDLVFQITFSGEGTGQQVTVRGPVAPTSFGMKNMLVSTGPVITGVLNTNLGSATGTQVFVGPRDDPFFLDLEQFFRIIPDRRPATGPLSTPLTPQATKFRGPTPTFDGGTPVDYLAGFNALAIVIELPESQLTGGGSGRIGVWGTISR